MAKDKGSRVVIDDASDDVAIRVSNVSKSFRLPHNRQSSIKGSLVNLIGGGDRSYETQEVLKDVSFEIKKGEFFGIVGRNGSGKSTLLKMLAGIYKPTAGSITVNGSLTPFIELGVGFNPELTGRENVYMNGALLGFNDREVDAMYDDIVEFAELERFMDQKLKNYSSGMQVRLAFSIAIRARSDILVLDEVLAVGDAAFQQKCIRVFEEYRAKKQTIILVTHDMGVVERFCTNALMISKGKIVEIGHPDKIARSYNELNRSSYAHDINKEKMTKQTPNTIKIVTSHNGKIINRFTQGQKISVELSWQCKGVKNVGVALFKRSGEYIFGPNTIEDQRLDYSNAHSARYETTLDLMPGDYFLKVGLFGETANEIIEFLDEGPTIIIEPNKNYYWGGLVHLKHKWS